jgi:hypothetical protein
MPCDYVIDPGRRLVVSSGTDIFRHADFVEHVQLLGADPRFIPEHDHLVDARHFEWFDLSVAQLRDMGDRSLFAKTSRRALVVSSALHFGLARMFAAFREIAAGQTTMVFRDMPAALSGLGLPADYEPAAPATSADAASE